MKRQEIEKFAVGYPYPTDWIESVLRFCDYDKNEAHIILCNKANTLHVIMTNKGAS